MWYSASILSKAIHPEQTNGADEQLWQESIILLEADSEGEARAKARLFGKGEEVSCRAISGEVVNWEFVRVAEVHEILDDSLKDGTELFSRFLRESEVKRILTPFNDEH